MIDLRSDTVTKPSAEMRRAMYEAELGDDVYREDPTVNRLQELAAERLGKEAALFVASGTMGNLASLLAHAARGATIAVGDEAHIFLYEQGGASVVGGLVYHTVPTDPSGELPLERLRSALRDGSDAHVAPPGLICLENTHNRCGGTVLSLDYHRRVRELAGTIGVPVHLDGARLANAAVALGVPMSDIAAHADSVQLDLSKGLAAPVGGIVAGSTAFVARAHRARKLLGGGMRQAGVIAAAGIVALDQMVERLADDHANARRLAEGLHQLPGIVLELQYVQTNLVVFRLDAARWPRPEAFVEAMREQGVLLGGFGDGRLRCATHFGIDTADIDAALSVANQILRPHT